MFHTSAITISVTLQTKTEVIMMRKYFLLSFLIALSKTHRDRRQISFSESKSVGSSKSDDSSKSNSIDSGITFSGGITSDDSDDIVLKDLLGLDTTGSGQLSARFGFSSAGTRLGQGCVTPLREQGSCRYIGADQCRPVLNAIIKHGVTKVSVQHH